MDDAMSPVTAEQLGEWKRSASSARDDDNCLTYAETQCVYAVPSLVAEVERLREALSAVLADMPIIDCDRLHHAKKDRHGACSCPVETRLEAAIARARAALPEERTDVPDRGGVDL